MSMQETSESARARPLCLVISPSTALWDQQTLVLLHGRGDTARRCAEAWRPLVDEGWTLVVPQSTQPWDDGNWCWDDPDLARREIHSHLEESRTRRGLDPARMVMAGAAEGAVLAMEIAHEAGLPWLCVIPAFPPRYDIAPFAGLPGHARGIFLLGESDPGNPGARPVIAALEASGAAVTTRFMPAVGHGLPADFPRHASDALRALDLG
jgi:predicted esterase